ncbi:MAG: hypothetical protein AAGC85_05955, partial [Bacteroidota bacterium]
NAFISVNSPNLGTPLAKNVAAFFKFLGKLSIPFEIDPVLKFYINVLLLGLGNVPTRGLESQSPTDRDLQKLNKEYNQLNTENHYFLGTQNDNYFLIDDITFNTDNDGVVPTNSMLGVLGDNYGYKGEELRVKKENRLIVKEDEGGCVHGQQYRTILLLDRITEILVQ